MEVALQNSLASSSLLPEGHSQAVEDAKSVSADFQTFLKMLTAQLKNQDPLNPTDASDYSAQLATFSNVEQNVKTNQLLTDLSSQFASMSLYQLGGWVGNEVQSASPIFFDGNEVPVRAALEASADAAFLVAKDESGKEVARQKVDNLNAPYVWKGRGASGALPNGSYSVSLDSYSKDKLLSSTPVHHYARVVEVRAVPDGAKLILEGGGETTLFDVSGIRKT